MPLPKRTLGRDFAAKLKAPRILGPNAIAWCKEWLPAFNEIYEKSEASARHSAEMRKKMGEPSNG